MLANQVGVKKSLRQLLQQWVQRKKFLVHKSSANHRNSFRHPNLKSVGVPREKKSQDHLSQNKLHKQVFRSCKLMKREWKLPKKNGGSLFKSIYFLYIRVHYLRRTNTLLNP